MNQNLDERQAKAFIDMACLKQKRYMDYITGAQSRGYNFELTYDQFIQFWQKPCFYCGSEIRTIGLDRVENKESYSIDNIVPCCSICNRMKSNLNSALFIEQCRLIAQQEHQFIYRTVRDASYDYSDSEKRAKRKNEVTTVTIAKGKEKVI